jgi:Mg2+ and Co2+ transporter CorA
VPCLFIVLILAFPRVVLVLMFLMSNYLQRAYHDLLLPVLGFIFLPLTTIVYAWEVNNRMPLAGINLLILVVAVVIDLGGLGGGEWHRRRRYYD